MVAMERMPPLAQVQRLLWLQQDRNEKNLVHVCQAKVITLLAGINPLANVGKRWQTLGSALKRWGQVLQSQTLGSGLERWRTLERWGQVLQSSSS